MSDPSTWSRGIVVYFNEHLIGEQLLAKEEAISLRHLLRKSRRGLDVLGPTREEIGERLRKLGSTDGFAAVVELLGILDLLSRSTDTKSLASPGYTNSMKQGDTQKMNTSYEYVMKHFRSEIRLEKMAALTNMSPTSFSRYFKKHANKTFSKFVSEIRIGYACMLLIEKQFNVSQACYASGFQTLSNFNRQFRAIMKRSPLEYKREFSNAEA